MNDNLIINHLSATEAKWFAVKVKFKTEKFVSKQLSNKGIDNYVPLITEVKRYTSKVRKVEKPLIKNYVFVHITKDEYIKVLETNYVFSFLKINKNIISIPQQEMDILKWVVGEKLDAVATKKKIVQGDAVEIVAGNLTGLRGTVTKKSGKKSFVVQLDKLGFALEINIPEEMLSPLGTLVVS